MDVIIRNQDIKLETICFGLTLAIFRFHLEKADRKYVTQLIQTHVGVEHSSPTCLAYSTDVKTIGII